MKKGRVSPSSPQVTGFESDLVRSFLLAGVVVSYSF